MNLLSGRHFLFVGLFLGVSALTPEECKPLVAPLAPETMMVGNLNVIMGYTDSEEYNYILRLLESCWMRVSQHGNDVVVHQENKINGTCFTSTENGTIENNNVKVSLPNITTMFQSLTSCPGCVLVQGQSVAKDVGKFLQHLKLNGTGARTGEIRTQAVYLLAKEKTVTDSDLQQFRQQAGCLGFSREPDFVYDPTKELCREGEGVVMKYP